MTLFRFFTGAFGAAVAFSAASNVGALVPDGWYVVSSFHSVSGIYPGGCSEGGGLFFLPPRSVSSPATLPAWPLQVPGLGCDLTGACAICSVTQGASCVLRRPDGALIVGERAPAGTSVDLHVLTLSGTAVVTDTPYTVGTAGPGGPGEIVQAALLSSGDILVGVSGIAGGPLAGARLGIVSPATGTVTPVLVTPPNPFPPCSFVNAVTADPAGTTAYLGIVCDPAVGQSSIYEVTVATGAATPLQTFFGAISNLTLDDAGQLLASFVDSSLGPPPDNLVRVDPSSGAWTSVGPPAGALNAVALERVTGNYAAVSGNAVPPYPSGATYWVTPPPTVATTQLTFFYLGWWGAKSGIEVNPDPESYGSGTPGLNVVEWVLTPNPGGLPEIGNAAFGLTVQSEGAGGPAAGLCAFSLGKGSPPVFPCPGMSVWLDPTQFI